MRRLSTLLALPLAALTLPASARPVTAPEGADLAFRQLAERFLDTADRLSPTDATALGDHRFDADLPDMTPAGRAATDRAWQQLLAALGRIDRRQLSREAQVDDLLLANELRFRLWDAAEVRGWEWNPQVWSDQAAGALYSLAARDFAPWDVRLKAATARMEKLPALLAQSRMQLVPAKVPPVYAEVAARQNGGIIEIAEGMLAPHADALSGADHARFDAALATLKTAVAEQQTWLEKVVVPAAKGDFRLGAVRYDKKMHFALMSDVTRPQLKARAEAAFAQTRAEMYDLSRELLAGQAGAPPTPEHPDAAQQQAAIEAALKLTYASRPPRAELEQRARDALATATAFVREKGLVGMPEGPVRVITMPKFQQGNAVAYNDPPGPMEKGQANFYAVSPIPPEWSDQQAASFLTEYNDFMIHDLSVHEAMPGHYLQLDHANRNPDLLRAVLGSGPFVEGWAVYAEGMMKDAGYPAPGSREAKLYALTVLKMRLRSVTNTLLDIGIQTEGMNREQAMELMMKGAFQSEREAAGKWVRANLSSVQLLSYFTGYSEHMALRAEAQQRWGNSYSLRRYNDAVLSYGSPPIRFVRELMFGLPVE